MPQSSATRGQVLVVDDDPVFCSIVEEMLRRQGYQSSIVYSVPEAIELLQNQVPDLVLTDIMMPEQDGLELVRSLREDPSLARIPTVVVSARTMADGQRAALEAGADEFIGKPFTMRSFTEVIDGFLSSA